MITMGNDPRLGESADALTPTFVHHYGHLRAHLQAIEIVKSHPSRNEPMVRLQLEALYDMALVSFDSLEACASTAVEALWCRNAQEFRKEISALRELARIDRLAQTVATS